MLYLTRRIGFFVGILYERRDAGANSTLVYFALTGYTKFLLKGGSHK
jgi:hypothetical protein